MNEIDGVYMNIHVFFRFFLFIFLLNIKKLNDALNMTLKVTICINAHGIIGSKTWIHSDFSVHFFHFV